MKQSDLKKEHTKRAIKERLGQSKKHNYLGDSVLGAIDGTVTTFAIVSGATGAGLRPEIAIILGLANLFADGFSMAASNFLKTKSDKGVIEKARKTEKQHIEHEPEGEREEIRQIFQQKGFKGETLEKIVNTITKSHQRWVNTMLTEELGLPLETPGPGKAAFATFLSFVIVGFAPLLPFFIMTRLETNLFLASSILTSITFFSIGLIKGAILKQNIILSALETLFIGLGSASIAYIIGYLTQGLA
ncbi:MAG: Integral membrane protein [uncultured bacterium]|nr:MAG: Integral membrane protein [uncultured bacterium]